MNSDPPRTCLVTGAQGWLGRCAAARLRGAGWRVRELTRAPSAEAVARGDAIPFHLGELLAPDSLAGADALVHCAYDFAALTPEEIRTRNILGARRLFEAARDAKIRRLVCISTMSAFPGCKSLYGHAKLEIERFAEPAGALVLRPGLIWGAEAGGMFGSLVEQVRNARLLPLIGGGRQLLYLVHEEDLCGLIEGFCRGDSAAPAKPITAAHGQSWTFREILEEIARSLQKTPAFVSIPRRFIWAGLKIAELGGLRLPFRSDSLVSLMNQDPAPDFSGTTETKFQPRPFRMAPVGLG